jgi:hypothetical protein
VHLGWFQIEQVLVWFEVNTKSMVHDLKSALEQQGLATYPCDSSLWICKTSKGSHGGVVNHYCGMKLAWQVNEHVVMLSHQDHGKKMQDVFEKIDHVIRRSTPVVPQLKLSTTGSNKE